MNVQIVRNNVGYKSWVRTRKTNNIYVIKANRLILNHEEEKWRWNN